MTDIPTLATGAAPTAPSAADPGELGPSITREAPKPSAPTFEQRRHAQDQKPAADAPPAPAAEPQQAPAAADGAKFKVGKFEVSEDQLGAMMERQAVDDLRKATIPPTPADYKLALPENLKLPGGIEFKFDEAGNKATFDAARAWAHTRGLNQTDFSEMMGLYASHLAQQEAVLAERSRQEITKAGINAPQRVDAVGRWITGMVGEADAAPIRATIVTDAHLRFYESIMTKLTNQGGASFSAAHRVPDDSRHEIPGYAGMSFEQRRQAQDQRAQRGGR
jgi:hypothetical protein